MEDRSSNQALEDDILRASMFLTLSKAFQRTAYHLDSQFSEPVIEDQSKIFAFGVSMVVLRVFAVELAIKALIAHVVREKPETTHRLMQLFNKLLVLQRRFKERCAGMREGRCQFSWSLGRRFSRTSSHPGSAVN